MWLVVVFICFGWMVSLCLHEFGHAIVAYWGGDTSVKDKGYLTLNPLKYTDPGLSLILPIFFLLIGGIALPGGAVYINQSRLRDRFWKSAVSAAGPVANIILILLMSIPFLLTNNFSINGDLFDVNRESFQIIYVSLAFVITLNVYAAIINLLPIPPLDGYGIIEPWLPASIRPQLQQFGKYGIWVLIGLLWFARPFNQFLWQIANTVSNWLQIPPVAAAIGGEIFRRNSVYLVLGLIVVLWIFRDKKAGIYRQGTKLITNGKYEEAIAAFDRAIALDPNYTEAWQMRGYALLCWQKYAEALVAYDRALEIKPDSPDFWNERGVVLNRLNRHQEALAAYQKAAELQPDFSLFWHNQGLTLFSLQRYEEAISACDRALQLQPNYAEALVSRGHALAKLSRYEAAESSYDLANKFQPNSAAWQYQIEMLEKLQQPEKVVETYNRRLQFKPNDVNTWYDFGLVLDKLQRHSEALAAYEEAIAVADRKTKRDKSADAWYEKGCLLEKLQRDEEALIAYDRTTTIQPKFYQAWYNRGVIFNKLQRYPEAIAAYERAIELKADAADAWYNQACCYALTGNLPLAISHLQRAMACGGEELRELAQNDPDFTSIRDEPDFQKAIASPN